MPEIQLVTSVLSLSLACSCSSFLDHVSMYDNLYQVRTVLLGYIGSFAYHAHGTSVTNPAVTNSCAWFVCYDKPLNQQLSGVCMLLLCTKKVGMRGLFLAL